MNITVCVMLPERGATDFSTSSHPHWRVLAPVAVTPMGDTSQPIAALRTGYIHVIVPPRPSWEGLDEVTVRGILSSRICKHGLSENRHFAGAAENLSPPLRSELLEQRQITLTWGQFKAFFREVGVGRPMSDEDLD